MLEYKCISEKTETPECKIYATRLKDDTLREASVLIVDTIGLLTKIYSYADIAYVGGAMGITGLHNILEPATFGVPIVIGKNYDDFPEAERLESLAGLFSIKNASQLVLKSLQNFLLIPTSEIKQE